MHGLRLAFLNRRFRWLLLAIAGIPIGLLYLARGVVGPLAGASYDTSDLTGYLRASSLLLHGRDPYQVPCTGSSCFDWLGPFSAFQPPVVSWLVEPFTRLPPRVVDVGAVLVGNLCLAVFLAAVMRALAVRDPQLRLLCILLVISWPPTLISVLLRQPQLLLLALGGCWALGYASRRAEAMAGVALGIASAIKLMQAPWLLLPAWRRHWTMLAGGVVAWGALWAAGAPRLLPEYFTRVLPRVSAGIGHPHNLSLAAAIDRLAQPATFAGEILPQAPLVRLVATTLAVAAVVMTLALMRSDDSRRSRLLEVAAIAAVAPLLSPEILRFHLVLELLPILILTVVGLRSGSVVMVAAAGLAWALIGLGNELFLAILADPGGLRPLLRPLVESALAGQIVLWIGALAALRESPLALPARPYDPQELAAHLRVVGIDAAPEGRPGR